MKKYIGTKLIEAEPAYRVDGKVVALAENKVPRGYKVERGYKVRYADGYESFSPNEVFERAYLPLEVNGKLKTEAPSISAEMVERFIDHHETVAMGGKTTVVRAVLKNGFEIVESSSCVSAENYDEKLGEEICMKRIRNKVWELLGFLLQTAVGGVNGEAINKDNEIEKLKADLDSAKNSAQHLNDQRQQYWRAWQTSKREAADLKNKLNDTEAALGRANACIATMQVEKDQQTKEIFEWQGSAQALHDDLLDARERANYAEAHPWRNLWKWLKREAARHE